MCFDINRQNMLKKITFSYHFISQRYSNHDILDLHEWAYTSLFPCWIHEIEGKLVYGSISFDCDLYIVYFYFIKSTTKLTFQAYLTKYVLVYKTKTRLEFLSLVSLRTGKLNL